MNNEQNGLTSNRRLSLRSLLTSFLVALALVAVTPPLFAQQSYETPPVLSASKILPSELLSGQSFRVQESVNNDGFLNIYKVDSPFGSSTAVSTALLRKRIHEINAMVAMEKVKTTSRYLDSLKSSGMSTLAAAKNMVFRPVKTATEVVSGVGLLFRRAGDSLFGPKPSEAEDSRFQNLVGFSNYKREIAYEFGVDVYSRNELLQDRLNELSWTAFAGGMTVSALMAAVPGGAGIAMTAIGTTRLGTAIFKNTPPQDLRRMNTEKLNAMGVDATTIEAFMSNTIFSPREQTIVVSSLDEMTGVAGRQRFVQVASLTNNADMAYFRQRQAEMYAGYHKGVAPLTQFVFLGQLAAARAQNGALVFNVPVDYMVWTESLVQLVAGTDAAVSQLPGLTQKQLWVTGTLSPRARTEIERLKWKVYERSEELVVAQNKPYSAYQRESGKTPSAELTLSSRSIALGAGITWGDGTLNFHGQSHPVSISGLSLIDLGISRVSAKGSVYDLNNLADFSGNYVATQATFAIAGGTGELAMINEKGVVITLTSDQSGTQLTAGPAGMSIKLK
jgi:hypothetical protein